MEWERWKLQLSNFHDRLKGVVIENADALDLIQKYDRPDALFYVDPPYTKSSNDYVDKNQYYEHDFTDADHEALATLLHKVNGMVVLSGYDSELYRSLYKGWQTDYVTAYAQGNHAGKTKRKEMIWMNERCVEQLTQKQMLFNLSA